MNTIALLIGLVALAGCLPTNASLSLPPSQDPWYRAPAGSEFTSPGTILRWRAAPGNLTTVIANASAAYNILFRTIDAHYRPSWAVTTLSVPKNASTSRVDSAAALLSYQIPYNTDNVDFSPSYGYYSSFSDPSSLAYTDVTSSLGKGWFISVPDHEGPLASFATGVAEGHAVIDSIRAVKSFLHGPGCGSRVALFGYSGGSIASEFAAELQVQYAPELKIDGVAIGGLPTNVTTTLFAAYAGYFAALVPVGLLGITKQYPNARKYLLCQLKETGPYNASGFLAAEKLDIETAFKIYAYQDFFQYFTNGRNIVSNHYIQQAMNDNGLMG